MAGSESDPSFDQGEVHLLLRNNEIGTANYACVGTLDIKNAAHISTRDLYFLLLALDDLQLSTPVFVLRGLANRAGKNHNNLQVCSHSFSPSNVRSVVEIFGPLQSEQRQRTQRYPLCHNSWRNGLTGSFHRTSAAIGPNACRLVSSA
jgi:hypothetical protein